MLEVSVHFDYISARTLIQFGSFSMSAITGSAIQFTYTTIQRN